MTHTHALFAKESQSIPNNLAAGRATAEHGTAAFGNRITIAMLLGTGPCLWLQGREICSRREQIGSAQTADDWSHQRSPGAVPVAVLHVIEVPYDVAGRAASEDWNRAQSA